jgi:hypothetical protein
MRTFLSLLPILALLAACAADTESLRVRAAFDMQCTQAELQLTELAGGDRNTNGTGAVYGVRGCGKQATYVYGPQHTWLMNSDSAKAEK